MDANRIKIGIDFEPGSYALLAFFVANVSLGYSKIISKTFTYGTPPSPAWVKIVPGNMLATLTNLFNNLVANDQDGNMTFSLLDDVITINFANQAVYILTVTSNAGTAFSVTTESYTFEIPVVPVDAFTMKHLQIEIIDTYENILPLQVEVTKASSPTLSYDGGDDLYEPLYTSNLKFNMRVPDYADAHFLHLFTGDEKRFKVKLNALNDEEEVQLYWQGYLLPDMLREPYTNNNLFVEFEAVDMLGSLKGKFFKPWQYYQRYNIATLFAMIFEQTGVIQPMVIRPSIIPAIFGVSWRSINVPLLTYVDGGKYTDLYTILTDVLQSNLLTCYSFKGTWFIDGVTRKNETTGLALYFNADGTFDTEKEINKEFTSPEAIKDSLYFSAMTPWKTVTAAFDYKGNNNVLPDDIVEKENFFLQYEDGAFDETSASTALMDYWKSTGTRISVSTDKSKFVYITCVMTLSNLFYNVSEATALNNYVDMVKPFYLYSKYTYTLEITIKFSRVWYGAGFSATIGNDFYEALNNFVPMQLLHNNVEILTNRPSYGASNLFKWEYEQATTNFENDTFTTTCIIKLNKRINVSANGFANLRFLAAIGSYTPVGFGVTGGKFDVNVTQLKVNVSGSEIDEVKGNRSVNYTNSLSLPLAFISTPDESVKNNFGLGLQQTPYEEVIAVGPQAANPATHFFPNGDVLFIQNWLFNVTADVFKKMFKDGLLKSMYVVRASGDEDHFYSWYGLSFSGGQTAHYVSMFDTGVVIPKDYKALAKIESGDVLKMALSNYPTETLINRDFWRVSGDTNILNYGSFMKTVIAACHNVRPSQLWVMEGSFLELVWPDQIQQFVFDGEERNFINTRLTLDLFGGKTSVYGREFKYENLTDISYE